MELARQPWPKWSTPASILTPHGREGMRLLGVYDRDRYSALGLLPKTGCPADGSISIWTNTEQRTIASGQALAEGLAPTCHLVVGHQPLGSEDPLFHPIEAHAVPFNAKEAVREVIEQTGGPAKLTAPYRDAIQTMESILDCRAAGCDIAATPSSLTPSGDNRSMNLKGPVAITSGTAEVFLLQYAEGMPLDQVGWGRATPERMAEISRLHALLFDIYARSNYIGRRIAGPLGQHMLAMLARTDGPRLNLMVASDNNIAALTSLLGVHFHIDGYGYDDPPPGGAFGLEVLRDPATGERYVRSFYQAQSLEQLRQLTPLSRAQPPVIQWLVIDACKMQGSQLCRLRDFEAVLHRQTGNRFQVSP
jgi:4-phytase/acid phosphatase